MSDAKKKLEAVPADLEKEADNFVEGFLKDPENKRAFKDFIVQQYKKREAEDVERFKARVEHEKEVDSNRIEEFHVTGNIEPLVSTDLNMSDVEKAFARGITLTKKNLVRSVEDRVEEINRLLAGIGGFSSQLKACFARSTVVFLEQEDPKYLYRDRLIFSIHLPNYELKKPLQPVEDGKVAQKGDVDDSGRTPVQVSWDDAVNVLAKIIESSGLKPKYCKNDRNYGHFVMKQDLRSGATLPDEYFSLTLDYNTKERIQEMSQSYNKILARYEAGVKKWTKAVSKYPTECTKDGYLRKKKKLAQATQARDFFVGTVPDPNNLEEGLLFLIEVSTQKDYHIVKDRMQSIMTKFILHLSKIAEKEAEIDPDLEYELWKTGRVTQGEKNLAVGADDVDLRGITTADIKSVQEYLVDESALKPKKEAA